MELEPLRLRRKRSMANLSSIQEHATILHEALSKHFRCQCRSPHYAHFRLREPDSDAENRKPSIQAALGYELEPGLHFEVFLTQILQERQVAAWSYVNIKLGLLEKRDKPDVNVSSTDTSPKGPDLTAQENQKPAKERKRDRVRFMLSRKTTPKGIVSADG